MLDGRLGDPGDVRVSPLDRGFSLADGVFEVLRTYRGEPFALEAHLARLRLGADRLGIPSPPASRWVAEVRSTLAAAANPESYLRLVLTRGVSPPGMLPSADVSATRLVLAAPLSLPRQGVYQTGTSAATLVLARSTESPARFGLGGVKALGYTLNVAALRHARSRGFDDALLISSDGALLEATSANVFVVEAGSIFTPSLDAGILPGITRALILADASSAGFTIEERRLSTSDLWTGDEVFLTSSVRELVPVVRIDEHTVGEGSPGPITRALHRRLRRSTPGAADPMPWE